MVFSQSFEGVISYEIKTMGEMGKTMSNLLAKRMYVTIKGSKLKCTYSNLSPKLDSLVAKIIIDGNKNQVYYVYDKTQVVEEKKAMPMTPEQYQNFKVYEQEKGIEEIKGYKCKKYKTETDLTSIAGRAKIWIWASKELKININEDLLNTAGSIFWQQGIEGFPLKKLFSFKDVDMEIMLIARSISYKKIHDDEFKIPENYKKTPFDSKKLISPQYFTENLKEKGTYKIVSKLDYKKSDKISNPIIIPIRVPNIKLGSNFLIKKLGIIAPPIPKKK